MSNLYPELLADKSNKDMEMQDITAEPVEVNVADQCTKDKSIDKSLYFQDGKRKIDFVLVYRKTNGHNSTTGVTNRKTFEKNLVNEGLELEYEQSDNLCCVKLHAPWDVLTRVAELIPLKMPIRMYDIAEPKYWWCLASCANPVALDPEIVKPMEDYFTADFSREREKMFIIKDRETFFTSAQRSMIVHELLLRIPFDVEHSTKFGIDKLIKDGTYESAFPLHEGTYHSEHSLLTTGSLNDRHLLYEVWASPKQWFKLQPLDYIRKYYGDKIAIYFSWLGYYTYMLIPAAMFGLIVFIFGLATMMINVPSQEICDSEGAGGFIMCPLCDKNCPYWKLYTNCAFARLTYVFDNYATVIFACFMAVWSTTFLEFWKRRQAVHQYDWDIVPGDEEQRVRPEYEITIKYRKRNPVTQLDEPYLPMWNKIPRLCTSFSLVLFMVCCVLTVVFGVIMYRVAMLSVLYVVQTEVIRKFAKIITSASAAFLNLVCILILNKFYERLAMWLTKLEFPRTVSEFENSFIFKMFIFQFLNFYTSTFYIAFFKGKLGGRPGKYDYRLGYRAEECDPAGCLIELCIQLGVIMVGKQALNNFQELMLPKIMIWFRSRRSSNSSAELAATEDVETQQPQWETDFKLQDFPIMGLFQEYLEMVIQYGFITIFVAAFPLAPFFALLNNIIEIRLDAYKLVTTFKRPIASRASDIGIWYGILRGITFIGIITNAFIIGWTSDFVPRIVYQLTVSSDRSLHGYVNNSLSYFAVNDFQDRSKPVYEGNFPNVTECRYPDYREPPISPDKYEFTGMYWHVFCARLAFVIVFEHFVLFLTWLVAYLIPDVPAYIELLMQRELHLAKEARYQQAFSTLHDERIELKRRSQLQPDSVNIDTSQTNNAHSYGTPDV